MVEIGQAWTDRYGHIWTVRQIHRKDRLAAMQGPRLAPRYVSFQDLGRDYRVVDP